MTEQKSPSKNNYLQSALKAGLSAKAAAVYVALLEAGIPLTPKVIINKTVLHRQYVYDALRELNDRRLIVTSGVGHSIKYEAASPDRLLQEAQKQHLDTLDGVTQLMQLYERSPAGVVDVVRGSRAVIESEFALLRESKKGDFLDIVGGAGMNWVKLVDERIGEWEELRKQKDITLRYIGTEEDVRHNLTESIIKNESRVIPGIGNIVNVAIRPDSVTFNIYEPEIVAVRVKNADAVKSQRALFEVLWKVAKI